MSRVFIEAFFPAIVTNLRTIYLSAIQYNFFNNETINFYFLSILFPNDDTGSSEIAVTVPILRTLNENYNQESYIPKMISIRNPVLCLCALIGAILGLYVSLMDNTFGMFLSRYRERRYQATYWSIAFLFFGLMNVAAIPLHCLLPVNNHSTDDIVFKRIPLPQQYPYLWMMDTFSTGVFSTTLIVALYSSRTVAYDSVVPPSSRNRYWYVIIIVLCGCVATSRFLIFQSTIELELWYILPLTWATLSFARELISIKFHHSILSRTHILRYYYLVALLLLFCGILVDLRDHNQQSRFVHLSWWWDCTRLPAIAFGACDIAFVGLYHQLRVSLASSANGSIKAGKYK